MAKKSCSGCLMKLLVAVFVIIAIIYGGFNVLMCSANNVNTSTPGLFERKASINDLTINKSYNFPVSISLEFYPKKDIEDLQFLLEYLDSHGNVLKSQVYTVGNVTHGQKYSFKISLSDVGIVNLLSVENCSYAVCSGTVSIFD